MREGWRTVSFADAVEDVSGGNAKTPQSEFLPRGRFAVVDQGKELIAGFVDDEARLCHAELPVIVFGDHTRCFKYVDFPFCIGADGVKVLRPTPGIDAKYLYRYLRQLRLTEGGYDRHFKYLRRSSVLLPPVSEQHQIAEVLDQVEALRAKRRAALAQLDTLAQAIFLDLSGDPATNPMRWPERLLGDLCEVKGGKRLPKGEEYSLHPTPFRYIRVLDLKGGVVDEAGLVFLKPEIQKQIERYTVNTGDVIISIAGSIGLIASVPVSLNGANLTENAAKLVPRNRETFNAEYLAALLRSPYGQSQIGSQVGQVTIGKLALFRIEKIRLPLPPLTLQHEFACRVAAVERLKAAQRASLTHLDALFASLQHRAFRGEL